METDPEAAYERQQQRERIRRRREESRRDDLRYAASQMIPDHGLAITLGQIATLARVSRQVATALYPSVADLAVELVCRAWRALIETTAPTPEMTTEDFLARLIQALRADHATHRVWQTIHSGLLPRTRRTMDEAEAFLAMAIGQALREIRPDIPHDAAAEVGDRVLSLARHAAYAASAPDPHVEAALIADLLPRFYTASVDVRPGVPPLDPAGDSSPDPIHFTPLTNGGLGPQAPAGPGRSPGLPWPGVQPGKLGRVHPAVKTVDSMRPVLALILLVPFAVASCTFSSSSPPPPAANTYVVPSPPPAQ
jgi:AcrR family transcriptional regulator